MMVLYITNQFRITKLKPGSVPGAPGGDLAPLWPQDDPEFKKHRKCDGAKIAWTNNVCDVLQWFALFLWKICLDNRFKSSENHSDQFWSNKLLVSLCEGPKPQNSTIS